MLEGLYFLIDFCFHCSKVSPIVPLSSATWSLSFAKYLCLRLHASSYQSSGTPNCTHSLHRDHVQYFAFGHTVAAFKLSCVRLREIESPSMVITVDDKKNLRERQDLIEMTKIVAIKGNVCPWNVYSLKLKFKHNVKYPNNICFIQLHLEINLKKDSFNSMSIFSWIKKKNKLTFLKSICFIMNDNGI